ncbi:hypothetical protein [Taklimakanibacter lacteus]|uniref:hypothetical protein n=1 Tax=Taklimakanibacter lacteus TaxID=2268456 RepID=UPI000E662FA1
MIDRDFLIPAQADADTKQGRLLFRYYKDRYAVMLLETILRPRLPIRTLRAGRYGRLLDRPAIKALAASRSDGWLDRDDLLMLWPQEFETYVLSFATWGSRKTCDRQWNQTSRSRRQLVLQLNFSRRHDAEYRRLVCGAENLPFVCGYHPVNLNGRNTMGWARIDIDAASGEALIEEVQNDWIRHAGEDLADAIQGWGGFKEPAARDRLRIYVESILAPHAAMWSEAVLAAALHVLIGLCGISRVWFHDFDTGCKIKRIKGGKPPRSLYTDLPKRFCFEKTDEPPHFLLPAQPRWLRQKLKRREGRFWRFDA